MRRDLSQNNLNGSVTFADRTGPLLVNVDLHDNDIDGFSGQPTTNNTNPWNLTILWVPFFLTQPLRFFCSGRVFSLIIICPDSSLRIVFIIWSVALKKLARSQASIWKGKGVSLSLECPHPERELQSTVQNNSPNLLFVWNGLSSQAAGEPYLPEFVLQPSNRMLWGVGEYLGSSSSCFNLLGPGQQLLW